MEEAFLARLQVLLLFGDDVRQQVFPALTCIRESALRLLTVKRCGDSVMRDPSRWMGVLGLVHDASLMSYRGDAFHLLVVDTGGGGRLEAEEVAAKIVEAAGCPAFCVATESRDMALALTGNPEPASFSAAHHSSHGLAVPYFLPAFERFLIREVPTAELLCAQPDRSLLPVAQTCHVKCLQGDMDSYEEYIAAHIGVQICDDHSPEAFQALQAQFEYPHITPQGDASYILVKELRNKVTGEKGYRILDGGHRAALLHARGDPTVHVAIVDPPPYKITVPAEPPLEPVHLDVFAFDSFGPKPVGSRKRARKLCAEGLLLLNGERCFSGVYVQPGDVVTLDAAVDPATVVCAAIVVAQALNAILTPFQRHFNAILTPF